MQAERWRRIDEIFHSALEIEESQRAAFLQETCLRDEHLRVELECLLALHGKAENFLESAAVDVAARVLSESGHPSADRSSTEPEVLGQVISHYRIVAKLGRGGMGFVYEAEDTRLGRRVALKFLPADLARHPRALERFEREARAASSLNHPNICTIYEVEVHDKQPVIVMELLEGQSLQHRIREGHLTLPELLEIGVQISNALEAAHAKGIVHRDIKPGNIFLVGKGRGQVKVLDFGLAKWIPALTTESRPHDESLTFEGTIAGTAAYMSPEQSRGEEIDGRSDLFSLGILFSELATGRQPFARSNNILTVEAILNADPAAPSTANPELPPEFDRIVGRLLEKRRELRYSSAEALCTDLRKLQKSSSDSAPPVKHRAPIAQPRAFAALACLLALGFAAGVFFYVRGKHALGAKDTIVLAEFENKTGDPVFNGTLRQGLAIELEQSPFLSLVPDERIQATLALMNRSADTPLTFEIAREICERTGAAAILDGSITSFGSRYVLGLRAKNCRTGDVIDNEQVQAARKEEVLNVLSQMARKFRTQVGESLATVKQLATPLAEATTPSLEALKQYSAALKIALSPDPAGSVPLLQRAIQIDPNFAMAYASLGRSYGDTWESALAAENITKAYQLRNRASDRERFFITLSYDLQVTGNLEKARRMGELWTQTYPRDRDAHALLSGIYQSFGQYEKGAQEGKRSIGADSTFPRDTPI